MQRKRVRCGRLERLAVERYVRDCKNAHKRGLYFDVAAAEIAIGMCQFIHHFKGNRWAGQVFVPSPWELFILWNVFGWKRKRDGMRRFRTAYNRMARKQGKTFLAAAVGIIMFIGDGEAGPEVYTAATKMKQAKITHDYAKRMVRKSKYLAAMIDILRDNMSVEATGAKFEPLGADMGTDDGLHPSCAIIDELHAHKTRGMWDVLNTATAAREQPLLFAITTAGENTHGICMEVDEYGISVLEQRFEDDSFFAFVCQLDKGDDPFDERNWRKANPNLDVSVLVDDLRILARAAKRSPGGRNTFLQKHMNVWTTAVDAWLSTEEWKKCAGKVDRAKLAGLPCCAGLDLAKNRDMTALVLAFPHLDGGPPYTFLAWFFLPDGDLDEKERKAGLPKGTYRDWAEKGYLILTSGFTCDYEYVKQVLRDCAVEFDLRDVAYDVYNATQIANDMADEGLTMVEFSQAITNMSDPSQEFERLMLSGELVHGDNPILNWHAGNVTVRTNSNGLIAPIKAGGPDGKNRGKDRNRIDGVVSAIMGLARAMEIAGSTSMYETEGVTVVG